jgi:hypothetical protein
MNNENTTPSATGLKKSTLVERALAFLKGGDDAKLARFERSLGKYFKAQIAIRDTEIEKLQDKITDAEEAFNDAVPNINPVSIASADSLDSYVTEYVRGLDLKLQAVENLQEQIEQQEAEKARLEKIQAAIYVEA